jgi:hypothetical protein
MNIRLSFALAVYTLTAFYAPARAQEKTTDSLRLRRDYMTTQAALRYPFLRRAAIESEFDGNMHYTAKLHGNNFLTGTIHPENTVRGWARLPIYTEGKQEISATFGYITQGIALRNTVDKMPESPVGNGDYSLQTLSLSLNYKRHDSLFHKQLVWGGSLIASSSLQSPVDRVSGLLYGVVILSASRTTIISAGVLVLLGAASITPVLPTFSYWHKFTGTPWEISADLPTHLLLRTTVLSKGLLSFGTELSGDALFKKIDQPLLPSHIVIRDTELKSGFTLEYPLFKKVLVGCRGGLLSPIQIRVLERSAAINDYYISVKRDTGPYLNFSISLLP